MDFKEFSVAEMFFGQVMVLKCDVFPDDRGMFGLSYLENEHETFGIPRKFVREFFTRSKRNTLRGLHFQMEPPTAKLVQVLNGGVCAVVVDLRGDSPTFLKHEQIFMSGKNGLQLWIPAGFALGYYVFEDDTIVYYKTDDYRGDDAAIHWNDPDIGIKWPLFEKEPSLSGRDWDAPSVKKSWEKFWTKT